jgi:PilZ domain
MTHITPLGARIFRLCGFRSSQRVPLMWPATIHWQDRFGDGIANGVCRNFSKGGLSMYVTESVPKMARVHVSIGGGQTQSAIVRYTEQQVDGFLIGLEFAEPCVLQRRVTEEIDLALAGMTW